MRKITLLMTAILFAGCSKNPQIQIISAKLQPEVASVGEKVRIEVQFAGDTEAIGRVQAVVREYPEYAFTLNDQGQAGDAEAGDGVWSYETSVPEDAPAQRYHLDILVKDKDGKLIQIGGKSGPATTLAIDVN